MSDAPFPYLHGTEPDEQRRLSLLNDLLNAASVRETRLGGGERILDVGCGLGQLTRALARAARRAVVAVEPSAEQRAEAERQADAAGERDLLDLRAGDATELPLRDDEWGTFDVAHARFVLEHVTDPLAAVRALVAAVRPGGRVVLEDDDHELLRLWPEPAGLRALWEAYMRAYERNGTDPIVGRRLVELLHAAGARPVRNTWLFFGSCAGNTDFEAYVENLIGVLRSAEERVVGGGLLSGAAFADGIAALRGWKALPDAAFWYGVSWAEGRRPPS